MFHKTALIFWNFGYNQTKPAAADAACHCDKVLMRRLNAKAALCLSFRRACVELRAYRYPGGDYKLRPYSAGNEIPGKGGSRDEAAPEAAVAHARAARVVRRDKGRAK